METAVSRLPREEFTRSQTWFEEFASGAWDAQIEADARAGKLDLLMAQAGAGFAAGRCTASLARDEHRASLRFRLPVGPLWMARVGLPHRALARRRAESFVRVWVGHHPVYDQILRSPPK